MENAWKKPFVVLKFPNANDQEPVLAKLLQAMGKPRKKFSGHWTLPTLRRNLGKSCEFGAEIEAMKGSYGQVKSEYLWPWHAIALFKAAMCKYHCNIYLAKVHPLPPGDFVRPCLQFSSLHVHTFKTNKAIKLHFWHHLQTPHNLDLNRSKRSNKSLILHRI